MTSTRELAAAAAWILVIGTLGTALALQGWRATATGTEVIPYIDGARALLAHGQLPDRGVITSLHSYSPPGLAWVMLPGIALFSDPRLFDAPGWVLLQVGTLIGVFLLARASFGSRCAFVSVLLYGLSAPGLGFAGSVGSEGSAGPSGHPFFYVWMAYWTWLWVARSDARYLAAAGLTWIVGMWIFMEIAPAAFMIPVTWMIYRPPVRLWPLLAAAVIALLIWFPYLRFEAARSFVDVRSQLLLQDATPTIDSGAFCDPTLAARRWGDGPIQPSPDGGDAARGTTRLAIWAGGRVLAATRGLVGNFEGLVPGAEVALLALTVLGLLAASTRPIPAPPVSPTALAAGLLAWAVVANEAVIGHVLGPGVRLGPFAMTSIRILQGLAALVGTALLMRRAVTSVIDRLASKLEPSSHARQILLIALVAPWLVLLLVIEPGRQDRLLGLWCLQAIVLSFVVMTLPTLAGRSRRLAGWLGAALIVLLVLINPFAVSSLAAWHRQGWSGPDAIEVRIADYLTRRLQSEGRTRAAIGYRLFADGPPAPPWKMADPHWKIGQEFDVALEYAHGMSNLDQCVEGASTRDEYRVVEVSPPSPDARYYFDVPFQGRARLLNRIGPYEVFKRE